MGTVTVSNARRIGNLWTWARGTVVKCRITMSNSYATGGDTLPTGSTIKGLKNVYLMFVVSGTGKIRAVVPTANVLGAYPRLIPGLSPKVLMTAGGGTPAEVANATDLSGTAFDVILIGRTV